MPEPTQQATVIPDIGDWAALVKRVLELEARVTALEEGATAPPEPEQPPASGEPSPDGTTTTEPLVVLVDDAGNEWRINEARSVEWRQWMTWEAAGVSYDVALIMKWTDTCYQCNNSDEWYRWTGADWVEASDPTKPPPEPIAPAEGAYGISNGQIVDSNGQRFIAHGFCLLDRLVHVAISGPDCKPLLDHYPSCNFLHIMPWLSWPIYTWPNEAAQLIEWATAKGIVCEIGNWWTWPVIPTGSMLQQECAWYADLARRYKDNHRVWFSTCNEPQDWYIGLAPGSITAEHRAVYDAIRNTGNNTLIGLLGTGGCSADGLTPTSEYATMRNVHWDSHYYNWLSGGSQDYAMIANAVHGVAANLQRIRSADGTIPCLFGEWGNATDGAHVDMGDAGIQAVLDVSRMYYNGSGAFCAPYWPADTGGQPNADQIADEWAGHGLTPYGKQVQAGYATPVAAATEAAPASTAQPAVQAAQTNRTWPMREALREAVEKWRQEHPA